MNANDIETRLAALERAKRVGAAICAFMVIGAVTVALRTSQGAGSEIVEASKFVVRDEEGRIRAELGTSPDGSVKLSLYDANEDRQVLLGISSLSGTELTLTSADHSRSATIWVPDQEEQPAEILLREDTIRVLWAAPYSRAVLHGLAQLTFEQELYVGKTSSYAEETSELPLHLPQGVVLLITDASPTGWAGAAVHTAVPGKSCVTSVGTGMQIPTTAGEGRQPERPMSPMCDRF